VPPSLQVPGNDGDEQLVARAADHGLADNLRPGVEQLGAGHIGQAGNPKSKWTRIRTNMSDW
jgi:hypothetical protein